MSILRGKFLSFKPSYLVVLLKCKGTFYFVFSNCLTVLMIYFIYNQILALFAWQVTIVISLNLVKKNLDKTLSIFNCLDDREHPLNQELGPNMVKQRKRDEMMKYFLWQISDVTFTQICWLSYVQMIFKGQVTKMEFSSEPQKMKI